MMGVSGMRKHRTQLMESDGMAAGKSWLAAKVALAGLAMGAVMAVSGGAFATQSQPGKPDFSGMWLGSEIGQGPATVNGHKSTSWPHPAPLTEAGKKALANFNIKTDDPPERCLPWGFPRDVVFNFYPMQLFQTKKELLMLFEYEPIPRRIYLDGRDFPTDLPPQWFGYSIGHWDGDTLVVETKNIRGDNILTTSGLPQSAKMHVTERFTLLDGGKTLEVKVKAVDPVYYTKPLELTVYWGRSNVEQHEFVCVEGLDEQVNVPKSAQDDSIAKDLK
ncbi:MAG TPA: hypothetical protein VKA19_01125 [Alphaproteobacteria bacterium]|nr:hypothetical protein [Alphaproteobacteria bacterium]